MACPAIITGDRFLTRVLTHLDCQADLVGSYGYQALGQPGSLAATVVAGLLTLFVALIGIRLLFGPPPGMRDIAFDALKVGVVLTLAFSWPAFRTVVLDTVVDGPAEIAAQLGTSGQGGTSLMARLQAADDAMLDLTRVGAGRNAGALIDARAPGGTFAATALGDESGYAWSRVFWLAGTIGVYGFLRLLAGLLLALAPLAAGLLLFDQTRGLFSGWLRGLVLAVVGTIGATLVLAVELSAIEPWLTDALRVRQLGYATPAAPTELIALVLGFASVQLGMLAVLTRIAFTRGWHGAIPPHVAERIDVVTAGRMSATHLNAAASASRAERISDSVEVQLRREGTMMSKWSDHRTGALPSSSRSDETNATLHVSAQARLGSSYRRTSPRNSRSAEARKGR